MMTMCQMDDGLSYYVSLLMRVGVDFVMSLLQGHLGGKFSTLYLVNGLYVNVVYFVYIQQYTQHP